MTNNEFAATLTLLKWKTINNTYINDCFDNETKEIKIIATHPFQIHIRQYIFIGDMDRPSHTSGLRTCDSYEEAINYISTLDMDNLPPNGKNR